MLPKKELNIYPKSDENLQSIISFYFDRYDIKDDNGVDILKAITSLSLNQIEFSLRSYRTHIFLYFKNIWEAKLQCLT